MNGPSDVVRTEVVVAARPATVFRCLVEADLLSRWLAATATIEPRVGGAVRIDFARYGTVVTGEVLELVPGERLAFSWGVAEGPDAAAMPVGSTRVEIVVAAHPGGALVTLVHRGLPSERSRRDHEFGWKGYLGQLAATAPLAQQSGGFEALVDGYLAAWAETDAAARARLLSCVFAEAGTFRDVHADLAGRTPLSAHIGACQAMFPGVRLVRDGAVLQSRASLLARWHAVAADGTRVASGFNHMRLDADGTIAAVEGFWAG